MAATPKQSSIKGFLSAGSQEKVNSSQELIFKKSTGSATVVFGPEEIEYSAKGYTALEFSVVRKIKDLIVCNSCGHKGVKSKGTTGTPSACGVQGVSVSCKNPQCEVSTKLTLALAKNENEHLAKYRAEIEYYESRLRSQQLNKSGNATIASTDPKKGKRKHESPQKNAKTQQPHSGKMISEQAKDEEYEMYEDMSKDDLIEIIHDLYDQVDEAQAAASVLMAEEKDLRNGMEKALAEALSCKQQLESEREKSRRHEDEIRELRARMTALENSLAKPSPSKVGSVNVVEPQPLLVVKENKGEGQEKKLTWAQKVRQGAQEALAQADAGDASALLSIVDKQMEKAKQLASGSLRRDKDGNLLKNVRKIARIQVNMCWVPKAVDRPLAFARRVLKAKKFPWIEEISFLGKGRTKAEWFFDEDMLEKVKAKLQEMNISYQEDFNPMAPPPHNPNRTLVDLERAAIKRRAHALAYAKYKAMREAALQGIPQELQAEVCHLAGLIGERKAHTWKWPKVIVPTTVDAMMMGEANSGKDVDGEGDVEPVLCD